jgi:RNA polymerase sigma-70 factor (ECF subfamily)
MTDWAAILAEHGPRVWRTAFRVLNHSADAHDCYQETFLAAWQLDRQRAVDRWEPTLVCLATRKAIDRLRKRTREAARTNALDSVPEQGQRVEGPLQAILMAELLDCLRTVLSEIPEKHASVVWLRCVEDLSHSQIANHLKISTGEVRVLLHRGRTRLQELLASRPSPIENES